MINVADLLCPNDPEGRTYRQVNADKKHHIPIGALVEVLQDEKYLYKNLPRLFVVNHTRDCDMTPLYYLSLQKDSTIQHHPNMRNTDWAGPYSDDSLKVVELDPASEIQCDLF